MTTGTGAAQPTTDRLYTVVYDGTCAMCQRIVTGLKRWDRGLLEIVPYQAPAVPARFPWIPPHAYEASLQLVGPGGETWQGAAAVEQLLRVLPRGRLIAWIFRLPFVRAVAERFYRWFARHRFRLGCSNHCSFEPVDLDYSNQSS